MKSVTLSPSAIIAIICLLTGVFRMWAPGETPPDDVPPDAITSDLLDECDADYRKEYAQLCEQMALDYPDGWTQQAVKEWNAALQIARKRTHERINLLRSEAVDSGTLAEFAAAVRERRVR